MYNGKSKGEGNNKLLSSVDVQAHVFLWNVSIHDQLFVYDLSMHPLCTLTLLLYLPILGLLLLLLCFLTCESQRCVCDLCSSS